jgi:50S ribosomal subunit-associated GTPase HflX
LKKSETKDQNAKHAQIEGLILNLTRFGANSHLNETTPFQTLFTYKKKEKRRSKNNVVLNDTIYHLLPLDA